MPRTTLLLGCCLVLASAALTWYWHPAAVPPTPTAAEPSSAASTQSASAEQLQWLAAPQVRAQQQRLAFHQRYRDFIAQAGQLDAAARAAEARALVRRYQALSAEREAHLAQRRDPHFERYKADEQRIVEDLLALQDIPDGLSRDQYLRQRLQEARERSYQ